MTANSDLIYLPVVHIKHSGLSDSKSFPDVEGSDYRVADYRKLTVVGIETVTFSPGYSYGAPLQLLVQ